MGGRSYATTAVVLLVAADQAAKAAAHAWLRERQGVECLPGLFNLAYVENRGCAWGLLQGQVWPLALFAVLALGLIAWKRREIFPAGWLGALAAPLLFAGIIGNLIDRLMRGFVIDFFDCHWSVHHFPVFNLADVLITLAAALLVAARFRQERERRRRGRA